MTDATNRTYAVNRCVRMAEVKIDETMGWLEDAARLASGHLLLDLRQMQYDLYKVKTRIRDAAVN